MHSGEGPNLRNWTEVIAYEVEPLPPGERASIAKHHHTWQILRTRNGVQGDWTGGYKTAEDALASLQKEFD